MSNPLIAIVIVVIIVVGLGALLWVLLKERSTTKTKHQEMEEIRARNEQTLDPQPIKNIHKSWGNKEWLADAERIMDTQDEPLEHLHPNHLRAMHQEIVNLREQLDGLVLTEVHQIRALRAEAVLRNAHGLVLEKMDDGDGSAAYWVAPGNSDEMFFADTIALPATLLFRHKP